MDFVYWRLVDNGDAAKRPEALPKQVPASAWETASQVHRIANLMGPQDPFLDWAEWRGKGGKKASRPRSLPDHDSATMVGRAEANQGNVEGQARDEVAASTSARSSPGRKPEQETSCASSIRRAKSYVTCLSAIAAASESMIRSAASVQPRCRSIISAERISEPGFHLVLAGVLRRRPVRGLEHRDRSRRDFAPGRDPDPADLGGEGVRDVVAVQVQRRDHVVLRRPEEDLLQEGVGDRVLDRDRPAAGPRSESQGPPSIGVGADSLAASP